MKRTGILAAAILSFAAAGPARAATDAGKVPAGLSWEECTVCIVGTPVLKWSGTSGSLHVDRVENRSHASSAGGSLGLQVQLQSDYPDVWRDMGVGEYEVSDVVPLGPLPIGSTRSDIDSGRLAFDGSHVPAGEYFVLVMIVERLPGGSHFDDYVVMDDKAWCDGSGCAIGRPCSAARVAGEWGYTKTGTLYLPDGAPAPFATLGILTLGPDGSLKGVSTGGAGGPVRRDVLEGTYEMRPDCTGTAAVEVREPSGALLQTIGMELVLDEGEEHLRGIVTSLVLPDGSSLKTVVTADARRISSVRSSAR